MDDACPNNGVCRNTEGAFVCDCPLGYKQSDDGTCVGKYSCLKYCGGPH